ncbi:MAG: outer membrane protein [Legionellales bacterium]
MDIVKSSIFGLASTIFSCSLATAGDMGSITTSHEFRPVASLQGGYALINAGNGTQRFTGTDSDVFTYINSGSGRGAGFIGVFLGAEHALPWISYPGLFMEAGVEYNYFGNIGVKGINTVGVEPQTSTTYNYNYNFQTQQVLGTLKLFATAYERFHPYGEVGLGAAFNHAGQYNATTTETGSINLTPGFSNQSQTQFSYSLGLGVDTQVNTRIRVGLGYRYSNFGSLSLNNGTVTFNNYQSPVSFALGGSNTYANQLIAHISYVA